MAWITTEYARAASGITISDYDSAAAFVAWAVNNGWCTRLSDDSELLVHYDRCGVRLTQNVETTVYVFRGLEHSFATFLARNMTKSTIKNWTYYAIDSDGDIHTVEAPEYNESVSGTAYYYCEKINANNVIVGWEYVGCKVPMLQLSNDGPATIPFEYVGRAERGNEADGWRVTLTYKKYAHIQYAQNASRAGGKWFIPAPPTEAKSGSVVHHANFKQYVAYNNRPNQPYSLYQNEETEVTEYSYLTEKEANDLVSSNTSANSQLFAKEIVINWKYETGSGWAYITNVVNVRGAVDGFTQATDSRAEKRFVGGGKGWCVTVTKTKYWASTQ